MITVHICSARERGVRQQDNAGGFSIPQRAAQRNGESFSVLQRIDETVIDPGIRLDQHAHHDVEILTYVVEGCLDYRDQTGRSEHVLGGELQSIRVGTGLTHSEANASHSEPLHIIQATLSVEADSPAPDYQRRYFPDDAKLDKLCLLASGAEKRGALALAVDATVHAAVIRAGEPLLYYRPKRRRVWVQVARGCLMLNDVLLSAGDAAAIDGDEDYALRLLAETESELLLFELP